MLTVTPSSSFLPSALKSGKFILIKFHLSINTVGKKSWPCFTSFYQPVSTPFMLDVEILVRLSTLFDQLFRYCILLACGGVTVLVCVMNKVSPFGKYGAKMHALMTCPCRKCVLNRTLAIQGTRAGDEYSNEILKICFDLLI